MSEASEYTSNDDIFDDMPDSQAKTRGNPSKTPAHLRIQRGKLHRMQPPFQDLTFR
jgi:hypothetical protein